MTGALSEEIKVKTTAQNPRIWWKCLTRRPFGSLKTPPDQTAIPESALNALFDHEVGEVGGS
jgi:hypothetical protein